MSSFQITQDVLLKHCDATGIMFLPRYFDMVHTTIERWFDDALDWPMSQMLGNGGLAVPVRTLEAEFPVPSRLGDRLTWRLSVTAIGTSSMDLAITAGTSRGGDLHMRCSARIVLAETGVMRVRPWPGHIRDRAQRYGTQTVDSPEPRA